MCVQIDTTRDIAAQILRHRSFSFQEFSQRYSTADIFETVVPELRYQDTANKQNSIEDTTNQLNAKFGDRIRKHFESSMLLYEDMIRAGVAKECARKVLPLQTPTRLYMTGTIRSWIHYVQIRQGPETQKEHREIAYSIRGILSQVTPTIEQELLQHANQD